MNKFGKEGDKLENYYSREDDSINIDIFLDNYILVKITADGIRYVDELDSKIENLKKESTIFYKIKTFFEKIFSYKTSIGIGLTVLIVTIGYIFDIKFSQIIKDMPLASSVIDTELLEQFEEVSADDEYYVNLKNNLPNIPALKKIENEIKDIKVKKLANNERVFKITLKDGTEKLINITKNNTNFSIKLDNRNITLPNVIKR